MPVYALNNDSETHRVPHPPGGRADGFARLALTIWASSAVSVEAHQHGKTQRALTLVSATAGAVLTRYPIDPELTEIVVQSGTTCRYCLTWTREPEPLGDRVEEP